MTTAEALQNQQAIAAALQGRVRGAVLLPETSGYDEARSVWNAMIDRRPALIVRCSGVADVVACVQAARQVDVPLSIKGGGHNIAGLAVCDGGLMLDMSLMRGVWVDPAAGVARAQAGCLLGDVDRETQLHGLAAVLGFVSNTGCAGLTLGGGFGYLTRRFGWTSDNVAAIDLVTAEGKVIRASEREHSDVFWGLRGGGSNFGVATSFDYTLHPVGPEIIGGAIAWRAEEAGAVLEMYRTMMANAPRELTCIAALRLAPPAPWIAKEVHGKPIVAVFVCYSGSLAEGEKIVGPLKAFGSPVGDIVQKRTYVSQQALLDATQPKGRRYYWKSEYLRALEPALFTRAIEQAARITSPHSAVLIFPLDGALAQVSEDHSPVGNRDAVAVLNVASAWDRSDDDAANIAWAREAWGDLRQFSTGGTYINFLTDDEGDERTRAAYRTNYARLAELKARWDPSNLFRTNKNIDPTV
jgi:FAD/FMN-containing dehydrogenase